MATETSYRIGNVLNSSPEERGINPTVLLPTLVIYWDNKVKTMFIELINNHIPTKHLGLDNVHFSAIKE